MSPTITRQKRLCSMSFCSSPWARGGAGGVHCTLISGRSFSAIAPFPCYSPHFALYCLAMFWITLYNPCALPHVAIQRPPDFIY